MRRETNRSLRALGAVAALLCAMPSFISHAEQTSRTGRNVIVFVADGLRAASVNPLDAPTLDRVRREGTWFADSHSVYPTFTTPNASAIATGHRLGDTGNFGNTLYTGHLQFEGGLFGKPAGTATPFLENDQVLADVNRHAPENNYLAEQSLLALARSHGYNTAAIGKIGPTAIQDVSQVGLEGGAIRAPETIMIDDTTGMPVGIPLKPSVAQALAAAGLPTTTPFRDQPPGDAERPGTRNANFVQQWYLVRALTQTVLPAFERSDRPFAVVFWSRDPDATQHSHGDSPQQLEPGINGTTSRAAVANADDNLRQILAWLEARPTVAANTDVFVTSDHGFATISKREIDATGARTAAWPATLEYRDDKGRIDVARGFLPPGFLAIDIAHALGLTLHDPDSPLVDGGDGPRLARVDPTVERSTPGVRQRPLLGNGILGSDGRPEAHADALAVVASGGGSDLVYVADGHPELVKAIAEHLSKQDYVSALFVDSVYGTIPGTLPMSAVDLEGTATMRRPTMVVSFRSYVLDPARPLLSAVQIADTMLQHGQGMHGALARDNTYNFMAALGPDFRRGYVDPLPVGNADITPTLASIMGLEHLNRGKLAGRVLTEALPGGAQPGEATREVELSEPGPLGKRTALVYRRLGDLRYLDAACQVDADSSREAAIDHCLPPAARSAAPAR